MRGRIKGKTLVARDEGDDASGAFVWLFSDCLWKMLRPKT